MTGTILDMLIFIFGYFSDRQYVDEKVMCDGLEINRRTLYQRLGELRRRGLLIKCKREGICGNCLTEAGVVEYVKIIDLVNNLYLRPELHGVHKMFKLEAVLPIIKNPATVIKVVCIAVRKNSVDVIDMVRKDIPSEFSSRNLALFKELTHQDSEISPSLDKYIRGLTMVGSDPVRGIVDPSRDSVFAIVIEAELLRRQGKIRESCHLYRNVLETSDIFPECWICSVVGFINCTKAMNSPEEAMELCDTLLRDHVIAPSYKACILKAKSDILSDIMRNEEAHSTYETALRIARAEKLPSLQGMIMNNIGVNYFRWKRMDEAKDAWNSARRHCKAHDLPWIKTLCEINLSDVESKSGNILKVKKYLRSARKFMIKIGDLEGVSEVDFNLALASVTEGKKDRALYHFRKCEEFPMMYKTKQEERRMVMRERFEEKGWELNLPFA